MRKLSLIVISFIMLLILVSCSYKELAPNEQIYISENACRTLVFNRSIHGYNNSISFYVITIQENQMFVKSLLLVFVVAIGGEYINIYIRFKNAVYKAMFLRDLSTPTVLGFAL